MEKYQQTKWISNPCQEHDMTNRLSIRAKEKLIELLEDSLFKINFNGKKVNKLLVVCSRNLSYCFQ